MNKIYYGAGHIVIGPYGADEISARARVMAFLRRDDRQVYEIKATSYQDARRKLMRQETR